jgi:hypothetical protein
VTIASTGNRSNRCGKWVCIDGDHHVSRFCEKDVVSVFLSVDRREMMELTVLLKKASYPEPVASAIGIPCLCYTRSPTTQISLPSQPIVIPFTAFRPPSRASPGTNQMLDQPHRPPHRRYLSKLLRDHGFFPPDKLVDG